MKHSHLHKISIQHLEVVPKPVVVYTIEMFQHHINVSRNIGDESSTCATCFLTNASILFTLLIHNIGKQKCVVGDYLNFKDHIV